MRDREIEPPASSGPAAPEADGRGGESETNEPGPRAVWATALTACVALVLVASLEPLVQAAASLPGELEAEPVRPWPLALALLPLLPFLLPALPPIQRMDRDRLATAAAVLAAAAAPALVLLGVTRRPLAAAVGVGAGALLLIGLVGYANRRAVAAGLAAGLVLEHALRVAGLGAGTGGTGALVVHAAIGLAALPCLALWRRSPDDARQSSFERRAGGLRLRGAAALGAILLLERVFLGPSDGAADWFALLLIAAGLAGWFLLARGLEVYRHRSLAVTLAIVAVAGALLPAGMRGGGGGPLWAAGHLAALLLLDRALAPASGRRSGWNLSLGLAGFAVLALVRGAGRAPFLQPLPVPIWTIVAGAVLCAAMYLTPRPPDAPPALPLRLAALAAGAGLLLAVGALAV